MNIDKKLIPPYSDCTSGLGCRCTVIHPLIVKAEMDEDTCPACRERHGLDLNVYAEAAKAIEDFKKELIAAFASLAPVFKKTVVRTKRDFIKMGQRFWRKGK